MDNNPALMLLVTLAALFVFPSGYLATLAIPKRSAPQLLLAVVSIALSVYAIMSAGDVKDGMSVTAADVVWVAALTLLAGLPTYLVAWKWWAHPPTEEEKQAKREKEDEAWELVTEAVKNPEEFFGQFRDAAETFDLPFQTSTAQVGIPKDLRTSHGVIIGGSGSGKTQLIQSLILNDLATDATLIVIDSQSELIEKLVHVVPTDRLVHITPTDTKYPLALNLFDGEQDASLYEYIFRALDAEMTSKQATLYRYVARLVSIIPGGTLDTMRVILEKDGINRYMSYVEQLSPVARAFFETEYKNRQYDDTKQQISRRLFSVLENDAFASMFLSPHCKVRLGSEIRPGKVILIDTGKKVLTGETFKIFGRFFIAQIARAIFTRSTPFPHPVYLYIDEFQEYAGEEEFISELFTQARKQNVGLMVAFQYLAQLPDKVYRAIMSNTAMKFIGKVSAADARSLVGEINGDISWFEELKEAKFIASYRNKETRYRNVQFGRLEQMQKRSQDELDSIRHEMRQRYSRSDEAPPPKPIMDEDPFADFEERS